MNSIDIYLPDGSVKNFDHEPTALEVAQTIGTRLAQDTLGVQMNESRDVMDLRLPLASGTKIKLITTKSPEASEVIRHSAAHVMAQAVQSIWPEIKVTIGPVIENGFFYDFDSPRNFSEDDLGLIEKKMQEIISTDYPLTKEVWPIQKAIETFSKMNERFKVEIIQDLAAKGEKEVSIYHQGPWFDLCRGPHIQRTGQIKAFKLLSVAGAYWRGDEKNPMLQRIYATAFTDKKELEVHLQNIEEAKKRDHRKLGKELGLFYFHEWAPGSPFFTPKGTVVYNELVGLMRSLYFKHDYREVITPQIFDVNLFKTSGHYQNYKENMFFTEVEEREFSSKPMNCPSHCLLFASEKHSYRELPLRIADFGRLHRYEKSGAMSGLTRVRTFCQDDAHVFCTYDQMQTEIAAFMQLLNETYSILGMDRYKIYLSTRPEKRMGSDQVWDDAESALASALKSLNLEFTINPGDGAFYGPKLDIMFVDALNRPWQLGTLQCDFNLPANFDLKYTGEDNKDHQPVILHRAILGSLERFIGVYLEHTAGKLPTWLSPTQIVIINVTNRVDGFCHELKTKFAAEGVRVDFDSRNEQLKFKIREAQLTKVPYMLIIGDQEAEKGVLSVRTRDGKDHRDIQVDQFISDIQHEIKQRLLVSKMFEGGLH
ncbi:MAG: threonine--tRNA ligase [Pseudobdellovibrionaceae bacterium]